VEKLSFESGVEQRWRRDSENGDDDDDDDEPVRER